MKTPRPPCPKCGERLWLSRGGNTFALNCPECGWKTGVVTLATGEAIEDVIAAKVEAATEKGAGESVDKPA